MWKRAIGVWTGVCRVPQTPSLLLSTSPLMINAALNRTLPSNTLVAALRARQRSDTYENASYGTTDAAPTPPFPPNPPAPAARSSNASLYAYHHPSPPPYVCVSCSCCCARCQVTCRPLSMFCPSLSPLMFSSVAPDDAVFRHAHNEGFNRKVDT